MNTNNPSNASVQILRDARALLKKKNGWIKGQYNDKRGGYCSLGALHEATMNLPENKGCHIRHMAGVEARKHLQDVTGKYNIARWNDSRWRMKWQILRAFDKAIAVAEKEAAAQG